MILFFLVFNNWFDNSCLATGSPLASLPPPATSYFYMPTRAQKQGPTLSNDQEPFHVIDDGRIYHTRGLNASCRRGDIDFVAAYYNILTFLYTFFFFYSTLLSLACLG